MSPAYATTNPAPAATFASRTVTVKSRGRPSFFASSESEFCVFAMHTGSRPYPSSAKRLSFVAAAGRNVTPFAP